MKTSPSPAVPSPAQLENTPPVTHKATAQNIADDYSVTPQHITRLANKGEIPGKRVGNVWRFNREEVAKAFDPQPASD